MTSEQEVENEFRKLHWRLQSFFQSRNISPRRVEDLKQDIQGYLDGHVYEGYETGLKLNTLELSCRNPNIVVALPIEAGEDIEDLDFEWEHGLAEIGKKYKIALRLSSECYR